ncbi:MAG: hypothetical protein LBU39_00150 [Desulfobulbaceae bacterium]|jgi:hypothetical protein|nr:hypothetical protein [Desulfobulbaceae bacterium]
MMKNPHPELENEWYAVRHSGEIPEIALHSALHYLREAADGPRLTLSRRDIHHLQRATALRFREIILRDMSHENLDKAIFRGLGRAMINFRRYKNFLARSGLTDRRFRHLAAITLVVFLVREWSSRRHGGAKNNLSVTAGELREFFQALGLPPVSFPLFPCETAGNGDA